MLLARRYGLACDRYGPCSDGKVVDAQFGHERAVNALLGLAARPRLLSWTGEIQAGVASCLEALVIDDDVLNNAPYALTPRPWDTDALDVEVIVDGYSRVAASWERNVLCVTSAASSSSRCSAIAVGSTNGSRRVTPVSSTWRARMLRSSFSASRGPARRRPRLSVRTHCPLRRRDRGSRVPRPAAPARAVD